jgi:quercetin dioxygenase-like cupin family protein
VDHGSAIVVDGLFDLPLTATRQPIYDQDIGITALHRDGRSGAEHYLIRYPAGMTARSHRHTAAHTIVVLEGALEANGRVVRAPAYCHFPAGERMHHAPADGGGCLFVIIFDGPFDLQPGD